MLALSAVDIALWDLKARRAKLPLWRLLGGFDPRVPCYAGGIDLDLSVEALLKQTDDNLAKGFRAIKMKVGRPRPRLRRRARGGDARASRRRLSADGGRQHEMDRRRSDPRRARVAPYDLTWLEEPIIPDDVAGHARIRRGGRRADRGRRESAHALGVQELHRGRRRVLSRARRHQLRRRQRRS